jgi:hypothetical protein
MHRHDEFVAGKVDRNHGFGKSGFDVVAEIS